MGDPAGIGGEIILKSLDRIGKKSIPLVIGDRKVLEPLAGVFCRDGQFPFRRFLEGRQGEAEFIDLGLLDGAEPGILDKRYGQASYAYILEALKLVSSGEVSAIVTSPINKASIHEAGIPFTGHTEMLAHFGGVDKYVMMMANPKMRVSLVTIHVPLREVPQLVSAERVLDCILITHKALRDYFAIGEPRLKVCGLNPHAGEDGLMGTEEGVIGEAILKGRKRGIDVEGPFPADTLFHSRNCDAYIAMYHDQGLIPVKTVDFGRTVNITLGIPFIRTSPGHGTGFDIAGKGLANPSGLIEAYRVAEKMSRSC